MTLLFIWTIITSPHARADQYEWRYMGEFSSYIACQKAVQSLDIEKRSRCIPK
jgi:hypothetical protein